MTLRRAGSLVCFALGGCLSQAASSPSVAVRPIPPEITPAWVRAAFPHCLEICQTPEAFDSLWLPVRGRPDFARALIQVIESRRPELDPLARGNAVLLLGGTGQRVAHEYLFRVLDTLLRADLLRVNVILALGSAPNGGDPTGRAWPLLENIACDPSDPARTHAQHQLRQRPGGHPGPCPEPATGTPQPPPT